MPDASDVKGVKGWAFSQAEGLLCGKGGCSMVTPSRVKWRRNTDGARDLTFGSSTGDTREEISLFVGSDTSPGNPPPKG